MKMAALCALLLTVLTLPAITASPSAKPEEVGLSSERLQRITPDDRAAHRGRRAGGRRDDRRRAEGKVAHHAAQGVMDLRLEAADDAEHRCFASRR